MSFRGHSPFNYAFHRRLRGRGLRADRSAVGFHHVKDSASRDYPLPIKAKLVLAQMVRDVFRWLSCWVGDRIADEMVRLVTPSSCCSAPRITSTPLTIQNK